MWEYVGWVACAWKRICVFVCAHVLRLAVLVYLCLRALSFECECFGEYDSLCLCMIFQWLSLSSC